MQQKINITPAFTSLIEGLTPKSPRLKAAIDYVLQNRGKELRAQLVLLTGQSLALNIERLMPAALAIECIHTYSLIHDDLPAMDNDDFRRGIPSAHKQFDEATAILTGDALVALANLIILEAPNLSADEKVKICSILNSANGPHGMIDGQMLDMFAANDNIESLIQCHELKTGALIQAAVACALALSPLTKEKQQPYITFAKELGLAFQIQDDYLDKYGNLQALGKAPGSDKAQGKITFADFFSQPDLRAKYLEHYQNARLSLLSKEPESSPLLALIDKMSKRSECS